MSYTFVPSANTQGWALTVNDFTRHMLVPCRILVTNFARDGAALLAARYGAIDVWNGERWQIELQAWPHLAAWPEVRAWGAWRHRTRPGDHCRLVFSQPRRYRDYLALRYVESTASAGLRSVRLGLALLDEVARLKQSHAILCDVANPRISHRALLRFGWEAHFPRRWHRHYIRRFYGCYPSPAADLSECLQIPAGSIAGELATAAC